MADRPSEYTLAVGLAADLAGEYAWVPETRQGYTWRAGRWQEDRAEGWLTGRTAQALREWDMRPDRRRIDAVMSLLRRQDEVLVPAADWDAAPWVLQTPAGIIDLRCGALRPAQPEDYCRRCTAAEPTQGMLGQPWTEHLRWMMQGDDDLAAYLLVYLGYALTGCRRNQSLLVLHGNGGNGKSVLLDSLAAVLGDYATTAPAGLLTSRDGEVRPDAMAAMQGRRLVVADESERGHRLNEAAVKSLTGSASVSARELHGKFYSYAPSAVYVIMTNHRPECSGTDEGLWRRLRLLPCLAHVTEPDEGLLARLVAEHGGGILAVLIGAAATYYRQGLPAPPAGVVEATREYRADTDLIGAYLAERTQARGGAMVATRALYRDYDRWIDGQGERALTARAFRAELRQRGWDQRERAVGTMWLGLELRTHEEGDEA